MCVGGGERFVQGFRGHRDEGSSPYMGNRFCYRVWARMVVNHSHVCGEQDGNPEAALMESGSSPCVRGTEHYEMRTFAVELM